MRYILVLFSWIFIGQSQVWAYPDFISYGYASCITCHYNSQGNGPLNDYGRGLWSAEIASRAFYDKKTTDEKLSEESGFLGSRPMPSWIRPGIKYRNLWLQTDPGSQSTLRRYITMQASVNVALHLDENQKYVFVAEYGAIPSSGGSSSTGTTLPTAASREHYLRWQVNDTLFAFFGLMDKAYGIRNIDHTSFARSKTGNAMNDQTHGVLVQSYSAPYEYTGHVFIGNLAQEAPLRQKGFSGMIEKDINQFYRVGGSLLASTNDYLQWIRTEGHTKFGFGKGNSLLAEAGIIRNAPKGATAETGGYATTQALVLLTRGYHFLSQFEFYNQTLTTSSPDQLRWTLGLLAFPAPRFEYRASLVNGRGISESGVTDDSTSIQAQIHISL